MIPMLRQATLLTILGLGTLAVPATAQGLALGLHKKAGAKVELDLRFVIGAPGHAYGCGRGAMQHWVPGRYECVEQRFWVPGTCEQVWVPARYELAYDACGRPYRRLVCAGQWQTVEQPGHWETREVRQWIEGHWEVHPVRG